MPNPIKYSTGSETLALKKGNFYIGTGDVGKGPTSTTGYYNGITPPSGGYTIYLNKASGGPSIYTVSNDEQLISLTNSIAGTLYTTANECLVYFASQTDKICVNIDYEGIVTDGLVFNVDAGFTSSYPRSGTTIYDISTGNNGTLTNGPTFNSNNGGSIVFDGVDDRVEIIPTTPITPYNESRTVSIWFKPNVFPTSNYAEIIITGSQPQPSVPMWEINLAPNNGLDIYHGGSHYNMGTNIISTSSIVNVHYLFNSTNNKVDFYLNGTLIYSNTIGEANYQKNNIYLGIGYWGATNINIYHSSIYNRALTSTEVLQNYNAQKGRFGL